MKSKILIVTEYFYPEEFKINEIALAWGEKGYEVDVLTQTPTYPQGKTFDGYSNRWYTKDIYEGINIYRVKAVTGYKDSLFKKLLKYFAFMFLGSFWTLKNGKKYDYIFGFDIAALSGMVPAVLLQKFYNKKVTLWIQDVWPDSVYAYGFKKSKVLKFFLDGLVRYVYRYSSNFAISAKGFEQKILPYLDTKKELLYAPNWADHLNKDLEKFKFSDDDKIHFTFAGNIGTVQNLDNIIKAFGSLEEKYLQRAQLNIIGNGSHLDSLQEQVKEKNIKNVKFWGRKPREEIYKYLEASNFLIVSLIDKEIFSLTVPAKTQTYIATGKPILGIIKGETANIIKQNNLGLVASPENIDDIKQIFETAINTDEEKKIMYTKNSEFLTSTVFNKEVIINNLLKLLKEG